MSLFLFQNFVTSRKTNTPRRLNAGYYKFSNMELSKYETIKEELEALNTKIIDEINDAIGDIQHPILLILQSHLYVEHLLERYISAELPNGENLIKTGNLTFYQIAKVSYSFGVIDEQLVDSLLKLNSLRNDLSHEFRHQIEEERIGIIGRTLGKVYSEIKKETEGCLICEIHKIMIHIIGRVAGYTFAAENLPKQNL
jgi:uncharacterized protein YutE (UPF0331/DUF86 family)